MRIFDLLLTSVSDAGISSSDAAEVITDAAAGGTGGFLSGTDMPLWAFFMMPQTWWLTFPMILVIGCAAAILSLRLIDEVWMWKELLVRSSLRLFLVHSGAMIIASGFILFWGFVPAYFKARHNTNETLFTLMMNYVAIQLVACCTNIWRGQASSLGKLNMSTQIGWFPAIFGQRYMINIIVILAFMVLMFVYLKYTKHGYEISVVGESANTARYAGINVKKVTLRTMLISGAICGISGFLIVAGKDQTISTTTAGGQGFTAIIVAWLSKFNTFFMLLISFLLIFLERGAHQIASSFPIMNDYASDIVSGIILFFILGCEFFINYKLIFRKGGSDNNG